MIIAPSAKDAFAIIIMNDRPCHDETKGDELYVRSANGTENHFSPKDRGGGTNRRYGIRWQGCGLPERVIERAKESSPIWRKANWIQQECKDREDEKFDLKRRSRAALPFSQPDSIRFELKNQVDRLTPLEALKSWMTEEKAEKDE